MKLFPVVLLLAACTKPAPMTQPTIAPSARSAAVMAELAALMKNEINPAFSKLTFLVAHGDAMDEEREAMMVELQQAASTLQASISKLRGWKTPPTDSAEGREVFYTFATSVDASTGRLVASILAGDKQAATGHLEQIADTCNNCHHFFRLDLEDSVVHQR